MNMRYKIEWRDSKTGDHIQWHDTKSSARSAFTRKKKEKTQRTVWADLFETGEDGDWVRVEGFEREQMEVGGHQMFTGRMVEY